MHGELGRVPESRASRRPPASLESRRDVGAGADAPLSSTASVGWPPMFALAPRALSRSAVVQRERLALATHRWQRRSGRHRGLEERPVPRGSVPPAEDRRDDRVAEALLGAYIAAERDVAIVGLADVARAFQRHTSHGARRIDPQCMSGYSGGTETDATMWSSASARQRTSRPGSRLAGTQMLSAAPRAAAARAVFSSLACMNGKRPNNRPSVVSRPSLYRSTTWSGFTGPSPARAFQAKLWP
jgi:hypothetical protein